MSAPRPASGAASEAASGADRTSSGGAADGSVAPCVGGTGPETGEVRGFWGG